MGNTKPFLRLAPRECPPRVAPPERPVAKRSAGERGLDKRLRRREGCVSEVSWGRGPRDGRSAKLGGVYPLAADHVSRPLVRCLKGLHQPVVRAHIRFSAPHARLLAGLSICLSHSMGRSASLPNRYRTWDCGHGGTLNSNTSCRLHTWSVRLAAVAGARGRHCVTESVSFVDASTGTG